MTENPQTNQSTGNTSTPSEGGGKVKSMRTSERKEEAYLLYAQMVEKGASDLEIKQELGLSDKQLQSLEIRWARVLRERQAGKVLVSASCLPLGVRVSFGMTSGDSLSVDIPFDKDGSSICRIIKAASPA